MPRSRGNWNAFFEKSDPKNRERRRRKGEKVKEPRVISSLGGGLVLPKEFFEPSFFEHRGSKSFIRKNADRRRANPTRAESHLERILNQVNGGVLRGRFVREHVASGKWIVDFFFHEIRLAIEVDGPIHNTADQRAKDKEKEADCRRFDITLLRLTNAEVFGDREHLLERLRDGWRAAKKRENRIVGKRSSSDIEGDGAA